MVGNWRYSEYIIKELEVKWINKTDDKYYLEFILNNYKY